MCPGCTSPYRAIGGDGPRPALALLVGERPGETENKNGRVFDGKAGQELDETYLPLSGLRRNRVRVCNAVRCWADNNRTPTDAEVFRCARHHLPYELEQTKPEFVVLMGASACKLCPGIKLDMHHGIPQHTRKVGDLLGWEGWIVPMYHPALGLHESRWMTQLLEDWEELGRIIKEEYWADDPTPCPTEYKLADLDEIGRYLEMNWVFNLRLTGTDTENHGGEPWSIQVSCTPGTGRLVRATDKPAMSYLQYWFGRNDVEPCFHQKQHDLAVLARMGIHPARRWDARDTMQEAFQLGNLPQGLKPLTYRLFRQTMTSWEDTVRPASIKALREWMTEALVVAKLDLTTTEYVPLKTKIKEVEKAGAAESLLYRLLRHTQEDSEYDPWGTDKEPRLNAWWVDPDNEREVGHLLARVGTYPILGIGNCTMEQAVSYACSDADWTRQVAIELERRRGENPFQIAEGDEDR